MDPDSLSLMIIPDNLSGELISEYDLRWVLRVISLANGNRRSLPLAVRIACNTYPATDTV